VELQAARAARVASASCERAAKALEVDDLIADRHAAAPCLGAVAKNGERQILDREMAVRIVGRGEPASRLRIVRVIEAEVAHGRVGSKWRRKPSQWAM
jgi:hypothetical protein